MLTYNPTTDIMCDIPAEPCQLTFWQLKKMADSCVWAERMYIELDMPLEAIRYAQIWHRVMKAMMNPVMFRR